MPYLNRQIIMGHLGSDPEFKYSKGGTQYVRISVATTESRKKGEEFEQKTTWHYVTLFGYLAQKLEDASKGDLVYIEGKTQRLKYMNQHGHQSEAVSVVADILKTFKPKRDQQRTSADSASTQQKQYSPKADFDDDIPF